MSERLRVGIGFDAHAFADGRRLVLAGVEIPSARGLAGHSDADLVSHAVTDALLGAAGGADIGELYPSDDPALAGASSVALLRRAAERPKKRIATKPTLASKRRRIETKIRRSRTKDLRRLRPAID